MLDLAVFLCKTRMWCGERGFALEGGKGTMQLEEEVDGVDGSSSSVVVSIMGKFCVREDVDEPWDKTCLFL